MKTKKILFVYTAFSTFVKTDYEILSSEFEVVKYHIKSPKGIAGFLELTKQFFYLLFKGWRYNAFFIWFADYHSFLPVLFAKITFKKSFVVIGGYDVANMPELKYGSLSNPIRRLVTLFTFRNASFCLPVVESLENRILELCKGAKTKTIYTGYNIDFENDEYESERDKIVLTVSITNNQQRLLIKGLDRFKELAERMPEFQFYIIGVNENARCLFYPVPSNLYLVPPSDSSELIAYYRKSSYYAQFSRSEGLPNAVCEAMLYGCVPLGMKVGGIPVAIDIYGLILENWDVKKAIDFIERNHNKANRKDLKNFILKKFDLKLRETQLKELVSES